MEHPIGRHRRPRQSLAGRVWSLTAAVLAIALAYVFVPQSHRRPGPERAAITPSPRRRELPPALVPAERRPVQELTGFPGDQVRRTRTPQAFPRGQSDRHTQALRPRSGNEAAPSTLDSAGTLVRPYMPPLPRVPVGDLLAEPIQEQSDDFADLAAVIRVYLDRVG
ncbi:hypothetical protein [Nocardiopsis sp. HUAS JQ3]|uniref:hypothetical protein n=1 Tax=Nocardiopsis sp. HUAS JQ3 TaxID=3061629 RepID=UPI0023A91E87|nr:hypothetical protein [Nocardiopsis sp. HUAS JQ3]WDZ90374.1 hypothetical protein PV789_26345 [Nocardiopsis sp. HUAS JQ3]